MHGCLKIMHELTYFLDTESRRHHHLRPSKTVMPLAVRNGGKCAFCAFRSSERLIPSFGQPISIRHEVRARHASTEARRLSPNIADVSGVSSRRCACLTPYRLHTQDLREADLLKIGKDFHNAQLQDQEATDYWASKVTQHLPDQESIDHYCLRQSQRMAYLEGF